MEKVGRKVIEEIGERREEVIREGKIRTRPFMAIGCNLMAKNRQMPCLCR